MNTLSKVETGFSTIASCSVVLLAAFSLQLTAHEFPPEMSENGRIQIPAWGYPGSDRSSAKSGAYIIDSHTGNIWAVSSGKPREFGDLPL